ncbi:MAG: sulfatase-like hydrolase/transferase [Chitinispirillaceae bacterium]|nr:sulfatase-like hydrolase/transferase [Chitinispirillaceae bacterium]
MSDALCPALSIAVVAAVLWLALWAVNRRCEKSAILIAVNLLLVFGYGDLTAFLYPVRINIGGFGAIGYNKLYFCAVIILNSVLYVVLKRWPGIEPAGGKVMLGTIAAAFVVSLGSRAHETLNIHDGSVSLHDQRVQALLENEGPSAPHRKNPDIFHIILDAHPRSDILKEHFDHDNSGFIRFLEGHGFVLPRQSWSNYASTELSIPATLNSLYVHQSLPAAGQYTVSNLQYVRELRANPLVITYLQKRGYRVYVTKHGLETEESGSAGRFLKPRSEIFGILWDEFNEALLLMTPARLIMEVSGFREPPFFEKHRRLIRFALEFCATAHKIKGPKYVFAHILAPHTPIVFGPHGEELQPGPAYLNNPRADPGRFVKASSDEIAFLDSIVARTISQMIAADSTIVIILQSDHGEFTQWPQEERPDRAVIRQRHGILNALRIPGRRMRISDTMTAINTYPVVFNALFGTALPLLEDRVFYNSIGSPFTLSEVSDTLGLPK